VWACSWVIAVTCLLVLVAVWYRVYTAPFDRHPGETALTADDQATRFLSAHLPPPVSGEEA